MLSGCLVDDPPPYVAPQQTPPRLNAHAAQPRPDQVIVANTNDTLTFQVPVTSEDAGESLTAQLLLDYNGGANASLVGVQTIAPSTANDTTGRQFNLSWQVLRVAPGCHRFTLRAAHSKNLPDANHLPLDPADLAEVYWFANIDADAANSDMLVKCP